MAYTSTKRTSALFSLRMFYTLGYLIYWITSWVINFCLMLAINVGGEILFFLFLKLTLEKISLQNLWKVKSQLRKSWTFCPQACRLISASLCFVFVETTILQQLCELGRTSVHLIHLRSSLQCRILTVAVFVLCSALNFGTFLVTMFCDCYWAYDT